MKKLPGKIAAINDLAGYGRCSLSVILPVISACGYQCCPVPTAVLSSTDGVKGFFLHDLTDQMPSYISHWESLGLQFDGIYSGYLGSPGQIDSVLRFLKSFRREESVLLVDPVLGDQGMVGSNCTGELIDRYYQLISKADIITPNITEAFFLTQKEYEESPAEETLDILGKRLLSLGPNTVVITGLKKEEYVLNLIYTASGKSIVSSPYCRQERIGTGDLFASILLSKLLDGIAVKDAVQFAADFVSQTLSFSLEQQVPQEEGICFEPFLGLLSPYYCNTIKE